MIYMVVLVWRLFDRFSQGLDSRVMHRDLGAASGQVVMGQIVTTVANWRFLYLNYIGILVFWLLCVREVEAYQHYCGLRLENHG